MLTPSQKATAQAIVNIFETGYVRGDYGNVTVIAGDTGHLTFGRSQTTLGSGNLANLIHRYCSNSGARFGSRLTSYVDRLAARDTGLDRDIKLHNILRATADDAVMRDTQDVFFDEVYWNPTIDAAEQIGATSALGIAIIYDSTIHGSWSAIRDRTTDNSGAFGALGERVWLKAYVETRHEWLTHHSREDLRKSAYRTEALLRLIDQGFWGLELPLVVRGVEISLASLSEDPPGCYQGPQPGVRALTLQTPLAKGLDARLVQLGLSDDGADIRADGVYGQSSSRCVRDYQVAHGLPPTGVADIPLIAQLVG